MSSAAVRAAIRRAQYKQQAGAELPAQRPEHEHDAATARLQLRHDAARLERAKASHQAEMALNERIAATYRREADLVRSVAAREAARNAALGEMERAAHEAKMARIAAGVHRGN
ncbi:MAG: hypothetical protein WA418_14495 [Bradyrhizobium sp.]